MLSGLEPRAAGAFSTMNYGTTTTSVEAKLGTKETVDNCNDERLNTRTATFLSIVSIMCGLAAVIISVVQKDTIVATGKSEQLSWHVAAWNFAL